MSQTYSAPFPSLRTAYLRAIARAWRDPEYQEQLVRHSNEFPRGVLGLLERDYGFTFPFDIKFMIDTTPMTRPRWIPVGTKGWFGFADRFHMFLPAQPERQEDEAAVLAEYCFRFPSMLGRATNDVSVAPPDFAGFGVITSRIIALAWHNELFRTALYTLPDTRQLVQDAMDYMVPWNFTLTFQEAVMDKRPVVADAFWELFPFSQVIVNLPLQPDDVGVEAIALAAYNDTGAQYPFTCG